MFLDATGCCLSDNPQGASIPARGGSFPTTRWSLVLAVGGSNTDSEEALATLCQSYWPAVYAYARYRGYSTDHAEDLTQGFFTKLLEKHYVEQADRERGKFRTFMLSSFKNYMANEWDKAQAQKRGGGQGLLSLDFTDEERQVRIEPADHTTPETIFVQRWTRTLLDRVLGQLCDEMEKAGYAERFDRLKGFLTGSDPTAAYREIAAELEMSESAVKVTVHRMRRRFAHLLREEVEHTVHDQEAVADEIRFLIEALAS
jgi:RNA polymerase sigma factor (sigma-70 family)